MDLHEYLARSAYAEDQKRCEWLADFVNRLADAKTFLKPQLYPNKNLVTGYSVCYQRSDRHGVQYLMISRHNTNAPMSQESMIEELRSPGGRPRFSGGSGTYPNRKGEIGTWQTVQVVLPDGERQWYPLSLSAIFPEDRAHRQFAVWQLYASSGRKAFELPHLSVPRNQGFQQFLDQDTGSELLDEF